MVLIPKGNFMMGSRSDSNRPKALFDEENRVVVSGNNLGEIAINKLGGDSAEINLDVNNSIIEIKILKGKQQVIIGTENGSIYLIDYESKKIIKNVSDHDAPISSIAIDPKGTSFITCDLSGKLVFRLVSVNSNIPDCVTETKDSSFGKNRLFTHPIYGNGFNLISFPL